MRNFHFQYALLDEGWAEDVVMVVGDDGTIADLGVGVPCPPFTDRLAGVAVPGMANLHSHAHQRAMAGLAERSGPGTDSFWTWREAMYRAVGALTPEDLQVVATQAFIEMLLGGYTHVAEFHYLHHQADGTPYADRGEMGRRIGAAAAASGIGLTLLPTLYAASGFDGAPVEAGQRRFGCDLAGFEALVAATPGVGGVAAHSLRAVPAAALHGMLAGVGATGPVHIHVAEQEREVAECLAATGKRPVRWLLDHAEVGPRWCLVHATHADAGEVAGMARSGAVVGLCPATEADLGDGVFPAADLQRAGGGFGVGSDSQVAASPLEELRLLEWGQRLVRRERTVLAGGPDRSNGRTLWEGAARAGAQACGVAGGALAVGQRADVTVLGAAGVAEDVRLDGVLDQAVFAPRGGAVRHVVVRGECVVRDGRHGLQDGAAERFARVMARLGGL